MAARMTRPTRVRAYDDGSDRWHIREAGPAPTLAGEVDRYAFWRERTRSFATRRELASTCGVFIVNLGAPLEIVDASGTSTRFGAGEGFLGGMARATSLSRSTGEMAGVHVHLPVERLARLAGVPLAALGDVVVRLEDVLGDAAFALGGRLVEASDAEARFDLLDAFLLERLARSPAVEPALARAFDHLSGGGRVTALAEDWGWSRKRLARWFRDATGMRPAQFAGLARFERLTATIQAEAGSPLAELAVAGGYADQAHMTHEVRRLAGMTPGELRSRLIPAGGGVRD